jgi:hypothetical protein
MSFDRLSIASRWFRNGMVSGYWPPSVAVVERLWMNYDLDTPRDIRVWMSILYYVGVNLTACQFDDSLKVKDAWLANHSFTLA